MPFPSRLTLALPALLIAITPAAAASYTLTDLGTLGGASSYGTFLNDLGQVAGVAATPDGTSHLFLYTNGTMINLNPNDGSLAASPYSLNIHGQVLAATYYPASSVTSLFSLTGITNVATLPGWNPTASATALNDNGQLAGTLPVAGGYQDAFIYSNNTLTDIGRLGNGYPNVAAINNAGAVVGSGDGRAFLYAHGTFTRLTTLDLTGPANEGFSQGDLIDNAGRIAGISTVKNGHVAHLFLYANNTMTDLGTNGADGDDVFVEGINDADQMVGYHAPAAGPDTAFLYANGLYTDLNTLVDPALHWNLHNALDINNLGQITGFGTTPDGANHAFLLTPTPEPTTAALVAFPFLARLARRIRR